VTARGLRVVQITDRASISEAEILRRVASVGALGRQRARAFAVQLRDPGLTSRELLALAEILRAATAAVGALLLVNDRLDVALAVGADGVHLGRRSVEIAAARSLVPGLWVSVACHSVSEVEAAVRAGADAAVLSPIFASPGKGTPLGLAALREARRRAPEVSLLALGGIDAESAPACFAAGASGVASIRADLAGLVRSP